MRCEGVQFCEVKVEQKREYNMRKLLALTVILALGAVLPGCCPCGMVVSCEEDPGVAPPSHACAGCWQPRDTGPAPESIVDWCRPRCDTGPAPRVCVLGPCPLFKEPAESCCRPACLPR